VGPGVPGFGGNESSFRELLSDPSTGLRYIAGEGIRGLEFDEYVGKRGRVLCNEGGRPEALCVVFCALRENDCDAAAEGEFKG